MKTHPLAANYNFSRYREGMKTGHYESFFLRANHPVKAQAFWIRYTIFVPKGEPGSAIGELWATWFDGATGRHVSVREELPAVKCAFSPDTLGVRIGGAFLETGRLKGTAHHRGHTVAWDLAYKGNEPPLYLFAPALYAKGFPRAKSLVGLPLAAFSGNLTVDGTVHRVDAWTGSQNHNWGSRHTDDYAWGQVARFDNAPASFLEIGTGRVKIGPLWTPYLTMISLRHDGVDYGLNTIRQALRARGSFGNFHWKFFSENRQARIGGELVSDPKNFVGLTYRNPPGGSKFCLNCKIASCALTLTLPGKRPIRMETANRAAFEILTDDPGHGVTMHV
ncbi:MAG: hypothetical protein EPN93_03770 [Spirochaetes bacterium]|nr:MAG: hypothetical protein EPN93_03770 [Spirochaetota bacterium]